MEFFSERFNRTIRDLHKKPVIERGYANWIDVLPTITKQYNNRIHSSTKFTPIQASLEKNKGFVHLNLVDKRKKLKSKYKIGDLVKTADFKKTFSKSDLIKWSYKLYDLQNLLLIQ